MVKISRKKHKKLLYELSLKNFYQDYTQYPYIISCKKCLSRHLRWDTNRAIIILNNCCKQIKNLEIFYQFETNKLNAKELFKKYKY